MPPIPLPPPSSAPAARPAHPRGRYPASSHPSSRRHTPSAFKQYTCFLGPLTLCVRETSDPSTLSVMVTRKPRARTFEQALVIRPGTVLCLHTARRSKYVRVRLFNPRIQYGRLVAGGTVVVDGLQPVAEEARVKEN